MELCAAFKLSVVYSALAKAFWSFLENLRLSENFSNFENLLAKAVSLVEVELRKKKKHEDCAEAFRRLCPLLSLA